MEKTVKIKYYVVAMLGSVANVEEECESLDKAKELYAVMSNSIYYQNVLIKEEIITTETKFWRIPEEK